MYVNRKIHQPLNRIRRDNLLFLSFCAVSFMRTVLFYNFSLVFASLLSHLVRCIFSRMFVRLVASSFASCFQSFAPLCTVYVSFFSGTTSFVAMVVRSFVVASMLHSTNAYYLFNFFYCISIFVLMWIQCTNCLTSSSNVCFCTCFLVSFSPYIRLMASDS